MPSAPQPKRFVATCDLLYAGRRYRKGEVVDDPRAIEHLVRFKTRYIAHKAAKAETVAEPPKDAAAPHESPKED